jgi:hypothetical protein
MRRLGVTPTKAGIQELGYGAKERQRQSWMPASAGMIGYAR